jgi:hypothetical protein
MADGVSNPMRVDTSLLNGIAAANSAPAAKSTSSSLKSTGTTTSFSSALKSASSSEKETTKPVEGQNYSEILTGPRAGMYLNTSGGSRDGEAFILVKHDGREDHIYGTGADRKVISVSGNGSSSSEASDDAAESTSAPKAPAGERTKAVPGHAYADILNGSRSGLYLNTSGNKRDGEVFALVKRDGREFHIYGTGKDRVVIGLKKHDDTTSDTSTKTTTDTTPSTTDNSGTTSNGSLVTDNPNG